MAIERIWVDCDEVLCDFVGGALQIHGLTREDFGVPGCWDMYKQLRMAEVEFWHPIRTAGQYFWTSLLRTPWADDLVELLNNFGLPWTIVTSPPLDCPGSWGGRALWLDAFCKSYNLPVQWVIAEDKTPLANGCTLLLDDKEENVDNFIAAGGDAILFPAVVNYLHRFSDDPVTYLKQLTEDNDALHFPKCK